VFAAIEEALQQQHKERERDRLAQELKQKMGGGR
jgi:hypothetical protein